MAEALGRRIRLSPGRRIMDDFLYAGMQMPLVTIQKDMNLKNVASARQLAQPRPSWSSIFTKAYGKVVASRPELRQAFMSFPRPRIFEYDVTAADIAVETRVGDEDMIVFVPVVKPDSLSLLEIDRLLIAAKERPTKQLRRLRRSLRLARFPRFIRRFVWWFLLNVSAHRRWEFFGTFGVTSVGNFGVESIRPIAPATSVLHYGALDAAGNISVRMTYDHRILDGSGPSKALIELEQFLKIEIVAELEALQPLALLKCA